MFAKIKLFGFLLAVIFYLQACSSDELPAVVEDQAPDAPIPSETVRVEGAIKVEIVETENGYMLLRGGEPYRVNGAGIEFGDIDSFARHGGNSFRTWTTQLEERPTEWLLDKAHELGLTVSLTLGLGAEHWGFDYDDEEAVARQFEWARGEVLKYKDHPALLTWFIGNELNYDYTNPKVFDAVNEISKMIHEIDPNHPTTTTLAAYGTEMVQVVMERAPDLDFLSFQVYGDLINLPSYVARDNFELPYFITEWGAVGHWEVGQTSWGAPIEQTSSEKAENYLKSYNEVIRPFPQQVLGNYVFLWGQKQERTPTWYGMFTDSNAETETIDVMHYIWNGEWPQNRTPAIASLQLAGQSAHENVTLEAGEIYSATLVAIDPEDDPLTFRWELRRESTSTSGGGAHEYIPELLEGAIANGDGPEIQLTTPVEEGAYRLFVYVYDDHNHAGHANVPFYINL